MIQPWLSICIRCGRQQIPPALFCGRCGYPLSYVQEKAHLTRMVRYLRILCASGGGELRIESLLHFCRTVLPDLKASLQSQGSRPLLLKDLLADHTSRLDRLQKVRDGLQKLSDEGGTELNVASLYYLPASLVDDLQSVSDCGGANRQIVEQLQDYEKRLSSLLPPSATWQPSTTWQVQPPPPVILKVPPQILTSPRYGQQRTKPNYSTLKSFFYDPFMLTAALAAFLILAITLLLTLSSNAKLPLPTNTDQGAPITIILVSLALLLIPIRLTRLRRASSSPIQNQNYRFLIHIYILASLSLVPILVVRVVSSQAADTSWIVPLAALYVGFACAICAISQQFSLFSYMSMIAFAISVVAIASVFNTSSPLGLSLVLLILLALPMLCSIERVDGRASASLDHYWQEANGLWPGAIILRAPMRRVMMVIVFCVMVISLYLTGALLAFANVQFLESYSLDFSLCTATLLVLLWGYLFLRSSGRTKGWFGWVLLSFYWILIFLHLLQSPYEVYLLMFPSAAFLYRFMSRFGKGWLAPFAPLALHLDVLAIFLVGVIPFASLNVLVGLFGLSLPLLPSSLISSALGAALAFTIAFQRTHLSLSGQSPTASAWRWLLLLAGFLATWSYSALLLLLHLPPFAGILSLTILVALLAIFVHRPTGQSWSDPLDALALGLALLTFFLSPFLALDNPSTGILLLFFAILAYLIIRYQDHFSLLFLPTGLALFGLIWLCYNPEFLFLLGLIFPFLAAALVQIRRSGPATKSRFWEWPLLTLGSASGLALAATHALAQDFFFALIPFPLCLALLAGTWYGSAILIKKTLRWFYLCFSTVFALFALLALALPFPSTNQLGLTLIAFCFAGTGFFVSLFLRTGRGASRTLFPYILPLYLTALFAAILTGINALSPQARSAMVPDTSLLLLIWAMMAYGIALFERRPLFGIPVALFGVWSILVGIPTLNPGNFSTDIMITTGIGIGSALAGILMRRLPFVRSIDSQPRP